MQAYSRLHPGVLCFGFLSVLLLTVFAGHPVVRLLSLLGALCFAAFERGLLRAAVRALPFFVLLALCNPLFVDDGVTVLFWLFDRPVTLEALLYGVMQSVSLGAALLWCGIYLRVLPAEQWLYLFGKRCPRLILTLCMALRFVPLLLVRLREADGAQASLGLQTAATGRGRVRGKLRVLASVLSLSLESAMETAASMQARGFALRGRTRSALHRLSFGDALTLGLMLFSTAAALAAGGGLSYSFYPRVSALFPSGRSVWLCAAFGVLAFWPAIYEGWKLAAWKYCESKI